MKHFKLRKDLSIEIDGKKLFRIEATENLSKHNVKKGDLGGFVEKESNLDGEKAVEWWKIWKPILKTICEGLKQ